MHHDKNICNVAITIGFGCKFVTKNYSSKNRGYSVFSLKWLKKNSTSYSSVLRLNVEQTLRSFCLTCVMFPAITAMLHIDFNIEVHIFDILPDGLVEDVAQGV